MSVPKGDPERVRLMLSGLSPVEQAVIVLHYFHEVSFEEIAQRLEISPRMVQRARARALREFRATFRLDRKSALARALAADNPVWPDVAYDVLRRVRRLPHHASAGRRLWQACLAAAKWVVLIAGIALLCLTIYLSFIAHR